jgi:hypothetical protein
VCVFISMACELLIRHLCTCCPQACAALANVSAENQASVVRCGGIELVVAALRANSKDSGVTEQASRAISVIASTEENRRLVVEAGGLGILVSALSSFYTDAAVLEHVSTVLTTSLN